MNIPIDLVYTYVDGNDPVWLEKKNAYFCTVSKVHNPSIRFENINEIYYSVCTALKFLPWIRNIFIVTDNQIPPLNELLSHPKIKIIDHTQIIPKKYLPVFFSDVIESYLHNIPNLSEIFISNNDDFFFFDHIKKSDLFTIVKDCNNKDKIKLNIINTFNLKKTMSYKTEYSIRIINTTHEIGGQSFIHNHGTKLLRKSTLKLLEKMIPNKLAKLRSFRFRTTDCIQYLFCALNIDHRLYKNNITKSDRNYAFYNFEGKYVDNEENRKRFTYKKIKFICYNNMDISYLKPFTEMIEKIITEN